MKGEAGFERVFETELRKAPFAVIAVDEGRAGGGQLGAVAVGVAVADLFFEGAVEAFADAVGFRFAAEGEAGGEAVEAALALEVVGAVGAAVIVAVLAPKTRVTAWATGS